jgi:Ca2+-binding RTX toxin-like protein
VQGGDFLYGEEGNDTIHVGGDSGYDYVYAGAGMDTVNGMSWGEVHGHPGDDIIHYDERTEVIDGGTGIDLCEAPNPSRIVNYRWSRP